MAHKISIYVDPELHREIKAFASKSGLTLSEFMVQAAKQYLHAPNRRDVAKRMDQIRQSIPQPFSQEEIREMRKEGRRF